MGSRVDRGGGRSRHQVILDSNHRVSFMSFLVDRGARGTRYLLGLILRFGPWVGGVPGVDEGDSSHRCSHRPASEEEPTAASLEAVNRRLSTRLHLQAGNRKQAQSKAKLNPGGCQLFLSVK